MLEVSKDLEDSMLNENINQLNQEGLIPDANAISKSPLNIPNDNKNIPQSANISSNKIILKIDEDSDNEIDENNDAEPEELIAEDPANRTVDDIWKIHMFGKRDTNEANNLSHSRFGKFFESILHPMEYGSLKASIFGLSSICLEAGSMVLGIRCKQFGLANFIVVLILGGLLAYWCLVMMIKAGKSVKEKSYSKTVKAILGRKVGIFMDIIITIDLLGELISFQVIIYQTLGAVVYDIMKIEGKLDIEKYDSFIKYKEELWQKERYLKFPIMFGLAVLVFPLSLLKDLTKMRIPSMIGVLALIYAILVVLVESFFYMTKENKELIGQMNWIDIRKAFDIKEGIPFFGGIATVFYLYSCHAGAFPVYKTLKNNTTRRIKKVFWRSILLDILIYVIIASASFITSPIESPEIILYRPDLKSFQPDYFILVAKIGIVFNTFFSTPANYEVFRLSFFELVWGNTKITNTKNILVTGFALFIVTSIGAFYDKILEYFELIGGFCTVVYCIVIPGLIYAKNKRIKKSKFKKNLIIFVVVFLLIIGYTSGILTILFKMVNIYPDNDNEGKE